MAARIRELGGLGFCFPVQESVIATVSLVLLSLIRGQTSSRGGRSG